MISLERSKKIIRKKDNNESFFTAGPTLLTTIREYREIMKDYISSDEHIRQRLAYLESLCHNVARSELDFYVKSRKQRKNK